MTEQSARVGISTISFRHRPLAEALELIAATGAQEIDLGAIPAVTDHVPVPFAGDPAEYLRGIEQVALRAGAVNSDPGDLNDPALPEAELTAVVRPLVDLAATLGAALIVPAGRADHAPGDRPHGDPQQPEQGCDGRGAGEQGEDLERVHVVWR